MPFHQDFTETIIEFGSGDILVGVSVGLSSSGLAVLSFGTDGNAYGIGVLPEPIPSGSVRRVVQLVFDRAESIDAVIEGLNDIRRLLVAAPSESSEVAEASPR